MIEAETIAIATAVLPLAVSITTAWLTYFHRGAILTAEPSMVAFGYDATQRVSLKSHANLAVTTGT